MTSSAYSKELEVALKAVHRASIVTKDVMRGIDSFGKADASPVTIADFAAQALIIYCIRHFFPDDTFVAEESADMLRSDSVALERVWNLVVQAKEVEPDVPLPTDKEDMMRTIDLGSAAEGPRPGRIWILDPVDGTATFMKSQQYAVCLCLTVDGQQQVAVLGCPNLRPDEMRVEKGVTDTEGYGVIVSAIAGRGAFKATLTRHDIGETKRLKRPAGRANTHDLQVIDSIKSSHVHLPSHQRLYDILGLQKPPIDIWSMQMKYISLAFGASDAMIRIPHKLTYRSSVWDHAGGQLIYEEAGGKLTDITGNRFHFGLTRQFEHNCGYVAADPEIHDIALEATKQVLKERDAS